MKKLLLTLAALPMATFAIEASAQTNRGMDNRIANLEMRLDAGVQAGAIDRREERNLRRQLRDLRQLEMQYSMNGLTRQERSALQQRIRTVRDQMRMAGGNGWANGYGWNDRDLEVYGNYGTQVTYDRYGRPITTNGYYGQGGPYEPVQTRSGFGIGDVIGNLLGLNPLSGNSNQFRDRSDVYFRSDGRQVYEIDARTNRVIRIHPMR